MPYRRWSQASSRAASFRRAGSVGESGPSVGLDADGTRCGRLLLAKSGGWAGPGCSNRPPKRPRGPAWHATRCFRSPRWRNARQAGARRPSGPWWGRRFGGRHANGPSKTGGADGHGGHSGRPSRVERQRGQDATRAHRRPDVSARVGRDGGPPAAAGPPSTAWIGPTGPIGDQSPQPPPEPPPDGAQARPPPPPLVMALTVRTRRLTLRLRQRGQSASSRRLMGRSSSKSLPQSSHWKS